MEKSQDDFYNFPPNNFEDKAYNDAVKEFPKDALVYLKVTRQVGMVEEVRATADGPRVKVYNIGSVPIDEIRLATEKEIGNSRFREDT